jgi:hypothetical protein
MTVMLRSLERVGPVALLGLCLALSTRASAHHSFAMYDQTKLVTLEGTVKEFQWTNPHVLLWVSRAAEGGGEPELWTIELPTSTGNLARMNWSKRSLTPGDHVTVELNPLRDGRHGGSFKKVTIAGSNVVLTATPPSADAGVPKDNDVANAVDDHAARPAAESAAKQSAGCACAPPQRSDGRALAVFGSGWLLLLVCRRRRQGSLR